MRQTKIVFSFFIIACSIITAQDNGFGGGIIFGEPTGLSAKLWIDDNTAADFGLGYSLFPNDKKISLHADYLFHLNSVKISGQKVPLYYGFGARLRFRERKQGSFGARGVIGALYYFNELPIDIFFEVVPVFQLLPETALNFDIGIGARYYFY